ncbi:hypothetical protein [Fodinicola feengrottensis]|uniref:Ig-like domain-containing protein n=1 Tax=Fodinicola feengrottensis TaxID=435914 RepID=A0ABN2HZM6_9ACTN|nr:hypothetical protein [Fodinicola feengrottensis]
MVSHLKALSRNSLLAFCVGAIVGTAVLAGATAPAYAGGRTCAVICTDVAGTKLHIDSIGAVIAVATSETAKGHVQVRWHQGGKDHTANGATNAVLNSNTDTKVSLNVNVDENSFACARFWVLGANGSFSLYHGRDYVCLTIRS